MLQNQRRKELISSIVLESTEEKGFDNSDFDNQEAFGLISFLSKDMKNNQEEEDQVRKKKIYKRGPYRKYNKIVKKEAVESACFLNDLPKASFIHDVPLKSLKHWMKKKERNKTIGRNVRDKEMEERLKSWICEFQDKNIFFPFPKFISLKAKEFSKKTNFKASRCWLEKFLKRNYPKNYKEIKEGSTYQVDKAIEEEFLYNSIEEDKKVQMDNPQKE